MLKFLETRDEVVDLLHYLSDNTLLSSFKLGVAGSYAAGDNKKSSPIDIVLKLRDGENKDLVGSFEVAYQVHRLMDSVYSNKIHIIWLDLLEKDEESLLNFVRIQGVEVNPESAYTNIVEKVYWIDKEDDDEEDEDEDDRISSFVTTWNEDDEEDENSDDEDDSDDEDEEDDSDDEDDSDEGEDE